MHISRLFHGLFTSGDRTDKTESSTSDAPRATPELPPQALAKAHRHGPAPRGHLSRHQLVQAAHAPATVQIADQEEQLRRLAARPDAHCFDGELREIRARIEQARAMGMSTNDGWPRAQILLFGAQTWMARLAAEIKQVDALPGGWRALVNDHRALSPATRAIVERRAFRAARLMCAERCEPREAMVMARRAQTLIENGCPETSALMSERVRRALMRRHPEGIVTPLTRMLRMDGPAVYSDAMAVLRVMTRLPAQMAAQLADAGVTIVPAPGRLANVRPEELGNEASQGCAGFYVGNRKQLLVVTRHQKGSKAPRLLTHVSPLHEAAHAYEHLVGKHTHSDREFKAAREHDLASGHIRPGRDDNFRDVHAELDSHPKAETFAESLAHYLLGDRRWPALHAYWDKQFRGAASGDPSSRA